MSPPESAQRTAAEQSLVVLALNRPLIGHLQDMARRLTDGDFEALAVWCEVAYFCLRPMLSGQAAVDPDALRRGLNKLAQEPECSQVISLASIVQATGIPRETVRRKLERLAVDGHVRRVARGWAIRADGLASFEGPR